MSITQKSSKRPSIRKRTGSKRLFAKRQKVFAASIQEPESTLDAVITTLEKRPVFKTAEEFGHFWGLFGKHLDDEDVRDRILAVLEDAEKGGGK